MPIITYRPLWFTARIFREWKKSSTPLALINKLKSTYTKARAVLFLTRIQTLFDASQLSIQAE